MKILFIVVAVITVLLGALYLRRPAEGASQGFKRNFIESPQREAEIVLPHAGFYFAGTAGGRLYLGNLEVADSLYETDDLLSNLKRFQVKLPDTARFAWRASKFFVSNVGISLWEGITPNIYYATSTDHGFGRVHFSDHKFDEFVLIDSNRIAYRGLNFDENAYFLCVVSSDGSGRKQLIFDSLAFQSKIFETGGYLTYDTASKSLVYVLFYSNKVIRINPDLHSIEYLQTMDSTTAPNIDVVSIVTDSQRRTLVRNRPEFVNIRGTAAEGMLFNVSGVRSASEKIDRFAKNHVIDVYQLKPFSYRFSFYVPGSAKLTGITIVNRKLAILQHETITVFALPHACWQRDSSRLLRHEFP
jgi:hypothetical protein